MPSVALVLTLITSRGQPGPLLRAAVKEIAQKGTSDQLWVDSRYSRS